MNEIPEEEDFERTPGETINLNDVKANDETKKDLNFENLDVSSK